MVDLVPVDHDPFSDSQINLIPVDHDPFSNPRISLIPVDHDPFSDPPPAIAPMGFGDTFITPDPSQWPRVGTVPRIIVHPKQPPSTFDGIDGTAPGQAYDDGPDSWDAPTSSPAPSTGQFAPGAQPAANPAGFNPPATWPVPPWAGLQNDPTTGGMLGGFPQFGSSSPDPGSSFPSPPQLQSASAQPALAVGRRPLTDYSTGEILGDAAKSFGLGVGQFGLQGAGLLGDTRETIANGVQRAADYFAPGSAQNAGSKVSAFLASYPLLAGPTSSQIRSAVESYTGPFYQPKTIVGDYARTAGEFVPGALLMPEGSLATNALRYGLLPALTSETAGQLTQGTAAEPWARAFGAILGAAPGALRDLPWERGAPKVAGPLPQSELSPAEQLAARRRAQLEVNKAAGAEFENRTATDLARQGANFARQITLETKSGLQTRMDFLSRSPGVNKIRCLECKASKTARKTANQERAFEEIEKSGATIVGAGKPGYEGGKKIPATQVEILRP
jgi:hypothetical protein